MSNKKKTSPGFRERTTMVPAGVTIGSPPDTNATKKHYVGADHEPTDEEALEMGRALYDAITGDQAKQARQQG